MVTVFWHSRNTLLDIDSSTVTIQLFPRWNTLNLIKINLYKNWTVIRRLSVSKWMLTFEKQGRITFYWLLLGYNQHRILIKNCAFFVEILLFKIFFVCWGIFIFNIIGLKKSINPNTWKKCYFLLANSKQKFQLI